MTSQVIRCRVIVSGRVQGVFFRETTRQTAQAADVAGWVRNLTDGTLESVFEGPSDVVEQLVDFCRTGPSNARVDEITVTEETPTGATTFVFEQTGAPGTNPPPRPP